MTIILILSISLFLIINIYFSLALRFGIIDNPNTRSSHVTPTIRGGGVIIPIAVILCYIMCGYQNPYFVLGLLSISLVSFIDDIKTLSNTPRVLVQVFSVMLVLVELDMFSYQWWIILTVFVLIVGTINAVNFMDGINGITVAYASVSISTILYVDQYILDITDDALLVSILSGLLVFGWYNFRKKARCFAGDVGSVSVAFILCYLIISLILMASDISFVLFLSVYGIDSVLTIVQRLRRRENIFKAHRLHLFQYLVNECGYPHLLIASLYAVLQLLINALVVYNYHYGILNSWLILLFVLLALGGVYIILKWNIHHKYNA